MKWLALIASLFVLTAQASTTINFSLDEPCKTSAGVYLTNGTLVRTLWSKVRYNSAGSYTATWDGFDDNTNAAAAGTYEVKVLQHNTEYLWNGSIGNTSTDSYANRVHSTFYTMHDMF